MRLRPVSLGLLLLAAAAGAEEQGGAPLESSKQALKALQADERAQKGAATTGKLVDRLPQVETPAPGATPLDFSSFAKPERKEKDLRRKRDPAKNWLVDGVEQLGRGAKAKDRAKVDDRKDLAEEDDEGKPDSSAPDYLLQLYDEQKKEETLRTETRPAGPVRNNPIAPFLQGWMGNSPVRGKFFDELVRKSDSGGVGSPTGFTPVETGGGQVSGHAVVEGNHAAAPAVAQPNPYLQGLDTAGLGEAGSGRMNQTAVTPQIFSVPAGAPDSPGIPMAEPLPPARLSGKKPPFLPPSDNEKYFPQQKKF